MCIKNINEKSYNEPEIIDYYSELNSIGLFKYEKYLK